MAPIIYGYWDLRGLSECIVFLLEHVGAEYQAKRYQILDTPPYKREWHKERDSIGLDFPNLPYLIDGDVKITHSLTILRRLARKFNLAGKTEDEITQLELVEQEARDLEMNLIIVCYGPEFETKKKEYLDLLPEKLELLSKYLGDRDWFVGDSVKYVDFLAYESLDHNRMFAPEIFAKYPKLVAFLKRVESLPKISAYMKSDKYKKWPIFAHFASFGGKGEMPQ